MTCRELSEEYKKFRAERLVLAVKWSVAREIAVSFKFTEQVLEMLQTKPHISMRPDEIVAMASRIRTRMQEQEPDKYKNLVESVEVKLLESVQ